MGIGDRVQHFSTGSIGTVIDSTYELAADNLQMCVQWEDNLSPYKDSWERDSELSLVSSVAYDFRFSD